MVAGRFTFHDRKHFSKINILLIILCFLPASRYFLVFTYYFSLVSLYFLLVSWSASLKIS